ncbi:MAG: hypothetical protein LBJ03_04265 [Holosporales bacterium]|jgi:hypothetical protein|nr:hypothetical protein [Holosporales bacterium]
MWKAKLKAMINLKPPMWLAVACVLCGCSKGGNALFDHRGYLKLQNISVQESQSFEEEKQQVKERLRASGAQ